METFYQENWVPAELEFCRRDEKLADIRTNLLAYREIAGKTADTALNSSKYSSEVRAAVTVSGALW